MGRRKKDILDNAETLKIIDGVPMLCDWEPTEDETYMEFKNDYAEARYDHFLGLNDNNKLGI